MTAIKINYKIFKESYFYYQIHMLAIISETNVQRIHLNLKTDHKDV